MIFNYNQKTFRGMYQGKESGRKTSGKQDIASCPDSKQN